MKIELTNFSIICEENEINFIDIDKIIVACELENFKGKSKPFAHRVLITDFNYNMINQKVYVGILVYLNNKNIIPIYISNKGVLVNSLDYHRDLKFAYNIRDVFNNKKV